MSPVFHDHHVRVKLTPRHLRKITIILSKAFTGLPTSCRHLFLSALPGVIIIRDPEWTFVAHGHVFRKHTCASHYLLRGQTPLPVRLWKGCAVMSGTGKGSGHDWYKMREWKEQTSLQYLSPPAFVIYKQLSYLSMKEKPFWQYHNFKNRTSS